MQKFKSLLEAIAYNSTDIPNNIAFADSCKSISWVDFWSQIKRNSSFIKSLNIQREYIFVEADFDIDYIIWHFAIILSNNISVPFAKTANESTLNHFLDTTYPKAYIAKNEIAVLNKIKYISFENKPTQYTDNINLDNFDESIGCEVLYTSGTTGKSKAVLLSQKNCVSGGYNTLSFGFKSKNDIELITPPLYHSQSFNTIRSNILCGISSILYPSYKDFFSFKSILDKYKCNLINIVPSALKLQLNDLNQSQFIDLYKNIKCIEVGTSVLEKKYKELLLKLLPDKIFAYNYGATECSRTVINVVNSKLYNFEALGKLAANIEIALLDDDLNQIEISQETVGRLAFKGTMIMLGYINNPIATNNCIKDGWYISNDLGYFKNDYIYILGRADDVINLGGEKISPKEIEDIVIKLETIEECCCIGVPDPMGILGQIPILFYTSNTDTENNQIKKVLQESLDRYKIPRKIIKLNKFPRNSIEKIDKIELKKLWTSQYLTKYSI